MAIDPLTFQNQQAYSSFDFSPLANLGKALEQRQTLDQLGSLYGQPQAPGSTPSGTEPSGQSSYASAISGIESSGKYDKLGPMTEHGDRAYGKYQVMGTNVPTWTREILGKSMTPDEFLANPSAQDAVFKGKFGQYVDKYGPRGAAKAWFAGERGMNNPDATDILGTTVEGYADKFIRGLGQ